MPEPRHLLNVRVTESQHARIKRDAKAAGMNQSEWIRYCVLREQPGQGPQRMRTNRRAGQLERASAAKEGLSAGDGRGTTDPPSPAESLPETLPNPLQLAGRAGVTVSKATDWLSRGVVEVIDGQIFVEDRPL